MIPAGIPVSNKTSQQQDAPPQEKKKKKKKKIQQKHISKPFLEA